MSKNDNGIYAIEAPENAEGYTASLIEVTFKNGLESSLIFTTGTLVLPDRYPFEAYESPMPMGTR